MIDFVEYVVSELRGKRLSKRDALALMQQFSQRAVKGSVLHPLLQSNTSDLSQQSYASIFTGSEFFLKDHRVQGRLLLPGVAYLEMARAAVAQALSLDADAMASVELQNVVWMHPVVVGKATEVTIALAASDDAGSSLDRLDFEIYSDDGEQETAHCQGRAVVTRQSAPVKLEIESLREQMRRGNVDASAVYAAFRAMGIDFGPAFQSVVGIAQGERQVLAHLRLPAAVESSFDAYRLHPSLLDGALQASIGLAESTDLTDQARLPFALESLRIGSGRTREMFAWVRYAAGSQAGDKVIKLDVDLCDEQGNVCVQMRGFSSRAATAEVSATSVRTSASGVLLAAPEWQPSAVQPALDAASYAEHHVLLCELPAVDAGSLGSLLPHSECHALQAGEGTIAQRYSDDALACFERIQSILQRRPQGKVLFQVVVADDPEHALFAGLIGLLKTATLENPQFVTELILIAPDTTVEELAARLRDEKAGAPEAQLRFAHGVRHVLRWQEVASDHEAPLAFKDEGVYLITGGLGALGTLFSREILQQTAHAKIILTGRAPWTAERQALVDALSADRVTYRQVDLADLEQVARLIAAIQEEHQRLDGVLHCAGLVADNFILKKRAAEFAHVLEPKVIGAFHLDHATRDLALDFLALFSSISGAMGNLGQADYAAANAFMDQFAAHRNRQVKTGQRHGRTVSINWPLWQGGGMTVDPANRERVEQTTGVRPMQNASGMQAFYRGLALSHDQVMVVEGDLAKMRRALLGAPAMQVVAAPAATVAQMDVTTLAEKTRDYLRKQFSAILSLPAQRIDAQAPLEHYGIDSIVAMKLTNQLEETFGSLSKTLFFEYQTIAELTDYLVQAYQPRLLELFAATTRENRPAVIASAPVQAPSQTRAGKRSRNRARRPFREAGSAATANRVDSDPIAIIGLSGRYPEAIDVEQYWENLRTGKDCITEVPKARWDWREYYSEDRTKQGHHYSKWGGFIEGVDEFDPLFFNISPIEAELLDPQERLFLQHAWMAVEDAGYTRAGLQVHCDDDLAGQVGVYVGVMYNEYQLFGAEASLQGKRMGFAINLASIANRVSYILNLHGPSMTVDTMCSSSLTAIHVACQDLKQGRTSLAIAGGVNISVHPNKYLMVSAGQAISSDGHCQSFGEGGDGYIPAEGVGVVVLKRLSEAVKDGDHIYGIIRGSALNHGGKTNGYTVPNPQAQAMAIRRALAESHTDPRHVSYIEAHGTGTKLGDPIEIAALSKAFETQETGFCLIGSAKSNIGHCESAAGIAGLTKVLLQMQHQEIVPSLHSAQLNPHIDFPRTPFIVNQTLKPWTSPVIDGRTLPRIAGISSFGAGGSNAHMIVEEYQVPIAQPIALDAFVIVLSARTSEQLQQRARDLHDFIRARQGSIDLASVAYTLQTGREAMDERLGFVVSSVEQLVEALRAFVAGEPGVDDLHRGQVKRSNDALALFSTDADLQQTIDKWIAQRKFSKLLELWVKGLELDWTKLYGETKPRRVSLPAYPFAKERYWIDVPSLGPIATKGAATAVLHPLLQSNTSDLNGQRYQSTFTGNEFFLADHQVSAGGAASQKVLPGVAYLEMARAAIEQALPESPEASVLELHNTGWAQPIVVDQSKQVSIALSVSDRDEIDFEVYSEDGEQEIIHCQGRAVFNAQPAPARLDLEALQARMTQSVLQPDAVYAACARMGLAYGPAFRGITAIHRGSGEVLAQLRLPNAVIDGAGDYVLHPSLMDGALQAAIGLIDGALEAAQPHLPFALETLRTVAPCTPAMVAWVRYAPGSRATDSVVKLDIDLSDEQGNVCVQMHGFSSRVLSQPIVVKEAKGSLLAIPVWQASGIDANAPASDYAEHHILLCELANAEIAELDAIVPHTRCLSLHAGAGKNIAERYSEYALACFERMQTILQARPEGKVLVQIVIADREEQTLFAGLSGLLKTAGLENPRIVGQLIVVPPGISAEELARCLSAEKSRGHDALIRYQQDARQVLHWQEVVVDRETPALAFKDQGVYLITGGLGGLGVLFVKEILARTRDARVIVTGRSPSSVEKEARLAELSDAARLSYRQLNLGDLASVEQVVGDITREFGQLNGILHSAGMIADHFIVKKSAAEFVQVLAPKVTGTFHLDQATRHLELDFFVLFSSITGAMGNLGQADYATANGFMDQFAASRNRRVAAGARHGRTRSINWPLWQAGGMAIDPAGQELLEQTTGVVPMQTATGLETFHRSVALPYDQILIAEGNLTQMRRAMLARPSVTIEEPKLQPLVASIAIEPNGLAEKTQDYLRKEFSEVLKLPAHRIDPNTALENYGIDSVLAMRLTNQLEKTFGSLSKTLFFEYQTIAGLAAYFAKAHPAIVREKLGLTHEAPKAKESNRTSLDKRQAPPAIRRKNRSFGARTNQQTEIAIVGLAGRYPQAENLQEFWRNLQNGRDCITEIPADRWDHLRYFDPNPNAPGKTYSKWGGFVADVDKFDPLFFNISPKEAAVIDPQERLFLETAWETIEDAGYTKETIAGGRVGVFVGVMWGQYELYGADSIARGDAAVPVSSHASIANRVSYFFDLRGPSISLDTMCSSSLTAIHLACEELRKGEIDAAIAGGVNLTVHPNKYLSLSQGKFIASDGRCRSFGAGGDGYVPGEGMGAVLLKPLDKALRDGDQIYAVIKSSSVNHGGKTNGYTVPNPNAQGELIRNALEKAKIDPRSLGYIETHGTGTSLGDPIEITGLMKAFEGAGDEKQICPIGSVKSNIGHLESAAGIAAVTKALLQIKHKQLVPSLHAEPLNPNINFADSPFFVQTELAEWKHNDAHPRRVGVSSFGAGGSNAHLVLEEYAEVREAAGQTTSPEAFLLSAKNPDALLRYAERVVRFLNDGERLSLPDMAYTSQSGRTPMDVRLAVVTSSIDDLRRQLTEWVVLRKSGAENSEAENVFYGNLREASHSAVGLIDGPAGKNFLRDLLTNREIEKAARLWTLGAGVDWSLHWSRMDRHETPRRVSLPTYPFAKERCWIREATSVPIVAAKVAAVPAKVVTIERVEEKQRTSYAAVWTSSALATTETRTPVGPTLILDETDRLFLAMRRQRADAAIVWVRPGEVFDEIEPNVYVINVEREEHFHELVASLEKKRLLPAVVVHHSPEPCNLEVQHDVDRELNQGLYALFSLCRALVREKLQAPPKILSVFCNDSNAPAPLAAAIGGFLRTLALEDPRYLAKVIDMHDDGRASLSVKAGILWDEIEDRNFVTQEIRYRNRADGEPELARFVGGLTPRTLARNPQTTLPLKQNGVYLMTGGLGGLGIIFSEYLAKTFQAKLVLIGRSANSAPEETLDRLRGLGAEVLCLPADVSRLDDMQRVVRETKARFAEIHGVIHAAGVTRDAFILKKTRDEIESVLAPKVYGAINLDLATRDEDLDFFVLFSSVAGVLGNIGQSDYAYANHFLDSFAERRESLRRSQTRSGRTLSIDWPLWQEGGMGISAGDLALLEKRTGISPLPSADGLQYWEDFLGSDASQGIALFGIPSRIAAYISGAGKSQQAKAPRKVPASAGIDSGALFEKTETYLKVLIGDEIKLDPDRIDSTDRLESFGIDSVMINRINAQLERDFGALPKTLLYERETVRDVAKFLVQEAREALISLFGSSGSNESNEEPMLATVQAEEEVGEAIEVVSPKVAEVEPIGLQSGAEEIAIIGVHMSYPHSAGLDEYWDNLKNGRDVIDLIPPSRWDYEEFYHPDPAAAADGKIYGKWGGFLDHFDKFDPHFFKISTAEAKIIDPQERLFLESVWSAIEDAGYTRDTLRARFPKSGSADVGVFVGVTTNSYSLLAPEERSRGNFASPSAMPWSIANRVSYFFDFNGPSLPIDTACSSSLVAVHLACESLRNRDCQVAIAGGVNLYLHPSKYQGLCQRRALSLDGKCRSYGAGDDGFVPAEGVGTLVLKPLSRAIEDRDRIYAVIRASAFDHSGRSNGYSAPNPNAQASLISHALDKAHIHPETIGYVEGHGTGTQLGDSIEIAALTNAFQQKTAKKQFCPIGSVKANIGHSESASGIAGIAKVLAQMEHRQLAPSIHSEEINPNIEFDDSPFYLQHGLTDWDASPDHPRRALINAFGAGGVNACVVLEEYIAPASGDGEEAGPYLFTLSARNDERLREYADDLLVHLKSEPHVDLASVCYTLQSGREAMEERLAIVVTDVDDLADRLSDWRKRGAAPGIHRGSLGPRRGSRRAVKLVRTAAGEQGLNDLAAKWAAGEEINWESLYAQTPRRVSLPTYPFARERYWVSDSLAERPVLAGARPHPLIAYNSSTLKEVSFSSSLSDNAFYAVDHKVHDDRIFPGAGFLEMACISANIASEQKVRKITDVVWIQPLSFRSGPQTLRTVLRHNGKIVEYEISSLDDENESIVHSEGRVAFANGLADVSRTEDRVEIPALKAQCVRSEDRAAYYETFRTFGLQYGSSFQTIQELYVTGSFALSRLKIAEHLKGDFGQFILHPSIIDGALQTVGGLMRGGDGATPYLPFALDELEILGPVPQACYAYAERADAHNPNRGGVMKFNIRILNEAGDVLIRIRNLYVRPLANPQPASQGLTESSSRGQLVRMSGESSD